MNKMKNFQVLFIIMNDFMTLHILKVGKHFQKRSNNQLNKV